MFRIDNRAKLRGFADLPDLASYEVEEFIEGELYHVDRVVASAGNMLFACASRYIAPCLNFEHGAPLGSVILSRSAEERRFIGFAQLVLEVLQLKSSAFHLEAFEQAGELIFLEIGARVPGADVSYVV